MEHDLVIRGGDIVDGTGAEVVPGDVAIDGGLISAMGTVAGKGKQEIDARGHVVSPGFIDLHTHMDAQIGWDPELTPVSWHGVTTALMGNCGVTFAPCKPADQEKLAGMMETVEDIPKHAIMTGLPWTWEHYGGYLDALDELKPGINVAGLVGHCAVRYYVMGERAVEEQATDSERKQMAEIVGEAIDAGAAGFSTNRYAPHKLPDGRSIPGTFADPEELVEIAKAVASRNALMQAVGADHDVLKTMADASHGRILFSYVAGADKGMGREASDRLDALCAGRDVTAMTHVRGSGFMFGLQSILPFKGVTWNAIRALDLPGRLAAIHDSQTTAKLIKEGQAFRFRYDLEQVFFLGDDETPDYTVPSENNVDAISKAAGEHFVETFLRISRETDGKGLFNLRMFSQNIAELGDLIENVNVIPSLGDAGAHVSQIMDAGWCSFILAYWVRKQGHYTLSEGIRRMTSGPARVLNLGDRGRLAVGKRADVNVFDLEQVAERQPELVHDFPGGAPRYIQRSTGYKATIVNGRINVMNGEHTGERAGQVLRHQR